MRIIIILSGLLLLLAVYLFQNISYWQFFFPSHALDDGASCEFIFNKAVRMLLNDLGALLCIYGLFQKKKYLLLSFYVFLLEFFVLLPLYLVLKLSFEGTSEISSPILSQFHRLIVNPTLMILLALGFAYQKHFSSK